MASQSLYRKWRSQTFSDLVGQEAVTRTLLNAVRDGRLVHAYLFSGPRGTGKTSTARLLAKAVNCAHPVQGEPCNECLSCREITAGHSPDVIEIDAASNTGVDNIRDLRENVHLLGVGGRYRMYTIDEAHMLSTQAFNALLKTLEEPPPHVIFVLATTEAHKVPPTVVSRCQSFYFRRFNLRDLVERIQYVAGQEGLELDPAAAEMLARGAGGGMRDALSLLDQAIAFCGTRIDLEGARTMLGIADPRSIRGLIEYVATGDAASGLHLINDMVASGADLRQLNSQLGEEWRALLLAGAGANVAALMDRSDDDAREISALAERFTLEELTSCARLFARNETPARGFPLPQMALELSFLDCIHIRGQGALPVSRQVQPPESTRVASRAISPAEPELPTSTPPVPPAPPAPPAPTPAAPPRQARPRTEEIAAGESSEELARVQNQWDLVKQVCKQRSHSVAALLHSAQPIQIDLAGEVPVLVLQAAYQFHFDKLREPASKTAVEWALEQVLGRPLRVKLTQRAPSSDGSVGARVEHAEKLPPMDSAGSGPGAAGPVGAAVTNVTPIRRALPPSAPPREARNRAGPVAQSTEASFPTAPIPRVDPDSTELEAEVRSDPVIQSLLRVQGIELVNVRARKESD
jgi:DNA polymerase III subunit gamma/tau